MAWPGDRTSRPSGLRAMGWSGSRRAPGVTSSSSLISAGRRASDRVNEMRTGSPTSRRLGQDLVGADLAARAHVRDRAARQRDAVHGGLAVVDQPAG